MFKINTFTFTLSVLLILGTVSSPCPAANFQGSVYSTQIIASLDGGVIPFTDGQDSVCYNYSLPYAFNTVPTVAVSVHSFQAENVNGLYFFIKPLYTDNLVAIPLIIRTQWPYTQWNQISFSIIAEDRNDIQTGYHQIDSGYLSSCEFGKSINIILPFQNKYAQGIDIKHNVFLHGFQVATFKYPDNTRSPFQLQIAKTSTSTIGISVIITVTTNTQVNSIYVSFVAFQRTSLQIVGGGFLYDITINPSTALFYAPTTLIPRNFARIYGFTGFLLNYQQNQRISYNTKWDGVNFNFAFQNGKFQNLKYFSFSFIFFTGSVCQDCEGMQIQYNNTCISSCPFGTYLTPDNTCIDCGAGKTWNGTSCIVICPQGQYLNPNTGICECPPTLNWDGRNCIPCLNGRVWTANTKSCECPKPLSWNGYACAKIDACTNGKVWDVFTYSCQCPQASYWDGNQCKNLPQCQGGQVLNDKYQCGCQNGYVWSYNNCIYSPCSEGQVWTGSKCTCPIGLNFNGRMCLQCINGQKWDSKNLSCACESGYRWNGQFCQKSFICSNGRIWNPTYQQCICPDGSYWAGYNCLPTQKCLGGQYFDSGLQKCVCLSGFNWDGKICVQCTNGRAWNISTLSCTCPIGTSEVRDGCRFQQKCTGGMQWNQNLWRCQCPSSSVWNSNYCIANPCQNGQVWNESLKSCQCPGNKIYRNQACLPPQIACNNGKIWNQLIYACACPQGTFAATTTCDPIPTCPEGRAYNPLNNQCQCPFGLTEINSVCTNPKCAIGQFWNGYNCQVINCPPPSYFSKDRCIVQFNKCNFGYVWNGKQCAFSPTICPQGTIWNNQACQSAGNCGDGQYSDKNKCIQLQQQCPPGFSFDGSQCTSPNSICPTGTYAQGGKCYPFQPCTNGFVWDADYLRCVCPPGTINNGNRCIECGGDKKWIPEIGCSCPQGSFDTGASCQSPDSNKCLAIANTIWNNNKCSCRPGFTKVGFQCICYGTQIRDLCDKCSYKSNSRYIEASNTCQCNRDYTQINSLCIKKGQQIGRDDPNKCGVSTYFDLNHKSCLPCPAGCLSCSESYRCSICAPGFSYESSTQKCIQMCGDGKRFVLECDDENNFDGDGCSKDCRIQAGYTCTGGSADNIDNCYTFQPDSVKIQQAGQIRKSSSIILNLRLNYVPESLLQAQQCSNNCNQILLGTLLQGDKNAVSITSQYLAGTRYIFAMTIQFGRPYIGGFKLNVKINNSVAKYFGGIGAISQDFSIQPSYLMALDINQTIN